MLSFAEGVDGRKASARTTLEITEALRLYDATYGESTAACFSPSAAKWNDRPDLIERYYKGQPGTGAAWPSLNAIKAHFDGSFNAAREAAGLPRNTPGPARRRRPSGSHAPIRDVRERVQTRYIERDARPAPSNGKPPKVERVIERVQAPDDKRLRKQATRAEQRLAKSVESLRVARGRLRDADAKARAAVRSSEGLRKRLSAVEARLKDAEAETPTLRAALKALERERDVEAGKLAREAETARDAAQSVQAELIAARARVDRLEGQLELSDPAEMARAASEVEAARGQVSDATKARREAEGRVRDAVRERQVAEKRAEKAEKVASVAEGERVRVVQAVAGHARRLKPAEIEKLRAQGPAGPAVFGEAIKRVVKAQSKGERETLREALRETASAAITWASRL